MESRWPSANLSWTNWLLIRIKKRAIPCEATQCEVGGP